MTLQKFHAITLCVGVLVLYGTVGFAQTKVMFMKSTRIKSSRMSRVTNQYEDLTEWEPSKLIFRVSGSTVSIDNKKNSTFSISNAKEQKDQDGTLISYDAVDETNKHCDVVFFFPKLKTGEDQWNLIYIIYSDIMWEHQVKRYYPEGQLDSFLDN